MMRGDVYKSASTRLRHANRQAAPHPASAAAPQHKWRRNPDKYCQGRGYHVHGLGQERTTQQHHAARCSRPGMDEFTSLQLCRRPPTVWIFSNICRREMRGLMRVLDLGHILVTFPAQIQRVCTTLVDAPNNEGECTSTYQGRGQSKVLLLKIYSPLTFIPLLKQCRLIFFSSTQVSQNRRRYIVQSARGQCLGSLANYRFLHKSCLSKYGLYLGVRSYLLVMSEDIRVQGSLRRSASYPSSLLAHSCKSNVGEGKLIRDQKA
jgi:hypothetical protein